MFFHAQIEMLSHFGTEHYCPLSLIRVYGTTVEEDYDNDENPDGREDDDSNSAGEQPSPMLMMRQVLTLRVLMEMNLHCSDSHCLRVNYQFHVCYEIVIKTSVIAIVSIYAPGFTPY